MKSLSAFAITHNGLALEQAKIPLLTWEELCEAIVAGVKGGLRLSALFAHHPGSQSWPEVYAVLADDGGSRLLVARAALAGAELLALTPHCPQAHLFEREIAEQFALQLVGHPWAKPVRFAPPLDGRRLESAGSPPPAIGNVDFFTVAGHEIHEVGVGPVHAGVIEPGHFRFQCRGEEVLHLEISLGYQHRGIERALLGGPTVRTLPYLETAAGDTTVGHATAYALNVEALTGQPAPARAQALRDLALELERLANHLGDLGALSGDVAFLPTAAYCGRIRGDFLNLTAEICGSRLGRGLVRPGGVAFDLEAPRCVELAGRLRRAGEEAAEAVGLLWNSSSAMTRFEDTGALTKEQAAELGLVGPAARACGLDRDVRRDHPAPGSTLSQIPVALQPAGDVLARARLRWQEVERSLAAVETRLAELAESPQLAAGPLGSRLGALAPRRLAVALVEGWRGEICHLALTDEEGRFARYKIVDPSFHNWMGLALALRGEQISDFPLCNKSFNLSYCGHDL